MNCIFKVPLPYGLGWFWIMGGTTRPWVPSLTLPCEEFCKKPWLVWLSGLRAGYEPKSCRFDSQSGHLPGLQARSLVGAT